MKEFLDSLKNKLTDFVHNIKFSVSRFLKSFSSTEKESGRASYTQKHKGSLNERMDRWFTGPGAIPVLFSALAILVVALVIVLLLGAGGDDSKAGSRQSLMDRARSKNVIKCNIESVNNFIADYYSALSSGDSQLLDNMYDDPQKARYSIETADIIEKYSDLEVYVTPGLNADEIAAFVYNNIYFNNISTPAPSVDSFYIKVDQDQEKIYIISAMYTDEEINDFLTLLSYREPVRSLLSSTEDTLYGILEKNAELRNLYVIMSTMTEPN